MLNLTGNVGIFGALWDVVMTMIAAIGSAWEWLSKPLELNIGWLKIPLILPDGLVIKMSWSPIALLGGSILLLLGLWLVKALVPVV